MYRINPFLIGLLALIVAGCSSGEKIDLFLNLEEGQKYNLRQRLAGEVTTTFLNESKTVATVGEYFLTYEVMEKREEDYELKVIYNRIIYQLGSGESFELLDYDSSRETDRGSGEAYTPEIDSSFTGMIGNSYFITVNRYGKISRIEKDSTLKALEGKFADDYVSRVDKFLAEIVTIFPDHPVGEDDEWEFLGDIAGYAMEINITYSILELREKTVFIEVNGETLGKNSMDMESQPGTLQLSGTQTGTMEVDRKTGTILNVSLQSIGSGEIEMGGMKAPLDMTLSTEMGPYEP